MKYFTIIFRKSDYGAMYMCFYATGKYVCESTFPLDKDIICLRRFYSIHKNVLYYIQEYFGG